MADLSAKLLVVDDLEDWQKTIRGVLQDKGYKVSVAGSSKEAVSLLDASDYDLALLDLRLDETDEENVEGLTLAKTIRDRWPSVKIVIVTGYGTPEVVQKSMESDAHGERLLDDFLPKDNTDKLVETVQRILAK
jgi:two-component system NtrC family response regulator